MSYKYLYIFFCLNGLIHLKDSSMGLADRRPFSTSTILELHCCTIFGSCYLQPINCALTSLFFVLNFKLYAAICGCRRAAAAPVVCFCHRSKLDLLCPVAAQFQLDTMSHLWLIYSSVRTGSLLSSDGRRNRRRRAPPLHGLLHCPLKWANVLLPVLLSEGTEAEFPSHSCRTEV